ncbi:hypothetical protein ABZ816_30825 [Actinosynnema sp. NPDC047251]|uniref:Secreted protein n=1 Tax=Saccharothrix espanaensis (strain ATCC 51144 / DSM 44229 / JCM 9112 / NBRC 15066 / NRRL 15764) TaxID=1179773 RepID=K0JXW7_SACES|nr:hypothetical protein [Saccharothrix espanaensis]CCH32785.1 hypothetical protein BN6_55260 [Saccharothrix espanaensis DSM 44229]
MRLLPVVFALALLVFGTPAIAAPAPGADTYAYTASTVESSFVEGTTNAWITGDDVGTWIDLPFKLPFYGTMYERAVIRVDGSLGFAGNSPTQPPKQIPSPNQPNGSVYAFWDDLVVDAEASVWTGTDGVAPNRRFIVEWRNVTLKSVPGSRLTAEVVFGENGVILLQYRGLDQPAERGATALVGVENADGTSAFVWSENEAKLSDGVAVRLHVPGTAIARGRITDANTGRYLYSAKVSTTLGGRTTSTSVDYLGTYQLEVSATDPRITVSLDGSPPVVLAPGSVPEHTVLTLDHAFKTPILDPPPNVLEITVPAGGKTTASAPVHNSGTAPGSWTTVREIAGGSTPPRPGASGPLRSWDPKASGVEKSYGVAELNGDVWLSSPSTHQLTRLTPEGVVRDRTTLPDTEKPADLALVGDKLCYVNSSTYDGGAVIHCVRPLTGEVTPLLTTVPHVVGGTSGLAYNPASDVFHLIDDRTVWTVKGTSHPDVGALVSSCLIKFSRWDPNYYPEGAALGPHGDIWVYESTGDYNGRTGRIELIDPTDCQSGDLLGWSPIPSPYNAGGMESDAAGNVWAYTAPRFAGPFPPTGPANISLFQTRYPIYTELPWLSSGTAPTIAPGATGQAVVDIDATTLRPGVHNVALDLRTTSPGNPSLGIPIRLTVT